MPDEARYDFSRETDIKERLWEMMKQKTIVKREMISFDEIEGTGTKPRRPAVNKTAGAGKPHPANNREKSK